MKAVSKGGELMGWTSPGQGVGMKDWRTAQLTSQGLRATLEGEPHKEPRGKRKGRKRPQETGKCGCQTLGAELSLVMVSCKVWPGNW